MSSVRPLARNVTPRPAAIPATLVLLTINAVVFAALLLAGAGWFHSSSAVQLAWGANFGPATQDGQWWRLVSALFMHFGVVHLALNLAALWDVGRLLEAQLRPARFTALYFASGITGNLASLVAHGDSAVSGGASGAIFGLYAAYLVVLWHELGKSRPLFAWRFGAAAAFCGLTLALGAFIPGIDQAAHVGGFVAGALVTPALMPQTVRLRTRLLAGAAQLGGVAALAACLSAPGYRWSEEAQARQSITAFLQEDQSIRNEWQDLLNRESAGASFEELAGRLEGEVATRYEDSFERLSSLHFSTAIPSSGRLEAATRYARARRDDARELAGRLRSNATSAGDPQGMPPRGSSSVHDSRR